MASCENTTSKSSDEAIARSCSPALIRFYRAVESLKFRHPVWGEYIEKEFADLEKWMMDHPQFLQVEHEQWREYLAVVQSLARENGVSLNCHVREWPAIPTTRRPIKEAIVDLPMESGVYFAFAGEMGRCVYVGQSKELWMRCQFFGEQRSDGNLRLSDWFAYLLIPYEDVFFAENYYIGILRPERNQPVRFCGSAPSELLESTVTKAKNKTRDMLENDWTLYHDAEKNTKAQSK